MKSKWLDWTPGSETIEKTANPEPTKPTEPGFLGFEGEAPAHFSITRDSKSPSGRPRQCHQSEPEVANKDALPSDPYAERLGAAMREVARPDYPTGMIPWLGQANPRLYAELTERLPDEIHRLWSGHAPLEHFERVLHAWLETHRRACALYEAYLTARRERQGNEV